MKDSGHHRWRKSDESLLACRYCTNTSLARQARSQTCKEKKSIIVSLLCHLSVRNTLPSLPSHNISTQTFPSL